MIGRAHRRFGQDRRLLRLAVVGGLATLGLGTDPARASEGCKPKLSSRGSISALLAEGLRLARLECWESALGPIAGPARLRPTLAEAQLNLGITLARTGNHEAALRALTEAARLKPSLEPAYQALGLT